MALERGGQGDLRKGQAVPRQGLIFRGPQPAGTVGGSGDSEGILETYCPHHEHVMLALVPCGQSGTGKLSSPAAQGETGPTALVLFALC